MGVFDDGKVVTVVDVSTRCLHKIQRKYFNSYKVTIVLSCPFFTFHGGFLKSKTHTIFTNHSHLMIVTPQLVNLNLCVPSRLSLR